MASCHVYNLIRRTFHMSIKDFQIQSKLGEGAYSSVYTVRRLADNELYALKQVKLANLSDKEKQNSLTEVRILASMKSPCIVGYKEAFIEHDSLYIVMEYMNSGDLFQKIETHRKDNSSFPEAEIWSIFTQVVQGLRALHHMKIMHRDLKSANVFLSKNGNVKLGDLNVSKILKKGLCETQTGTPYYASPEVWCDQPYDYKSDIWSLGCVLYEVVTLRPPFRAEDMEGLYKKVMKGVYPKISSKYSKDLAQMIKQLLQINPNLRPGCDDIMNTPAFKMNCLNDTSGKQSQESSLLKTIRISKNMKQQGALFPSSTYSISSKSGSVHVKNLFLPPINQKSSYSKQKRDPRDHRDYRDYSSKREKQNSKSVGEEENKAPRMKVAKKRIKVNQMKKIYLQ